MPDPLTYFDLSIHLVATAASQRYNSPMKENLEKTIQELSDASIINGDQKTALITIAGRLDPEVVWKDSSKQPRGGSYTEDDLESERGEHNLVRWLTVELERVADQFSEAETRRLIEEIRGLLETRPT